ncbi:transposase [Priestia megaterium]|uniref:IS91 family transposase n=1 Tax=Priestia megaterium TaxID=1404 RepID=UPI002E1AA845|nr:transposase [Priestia megaterium]MED3816168.1 transposase [Priestia megaterium]
METNILREIFFDESQHWDRFEKKHGRKIRPIVRKEVEKFRNCGNPKNGFKLFVCEGCHDVRRVPYRCKGRFCTTCSVGETEEWSRLLEHEVFQVNHRHIILTIAEGLRDVFLKHRKLLKEFMDEGARFIREYFEKKHKVNPGIIVGLHTFGSRINFNPHLHLLVTMGGMKQNGEWKTYDFLPFEMLRKQWQTIVLKLIRRLLTEEEKKEVQRLLQKAYSANGEGFYVHAPKQKGNIKAQLAYIGRYIRRPAIALGRIEEYDGQFVTFRYKDKTDGQEKTETVTVEEFIARLIRHIPDEQFKTIRYYGVYARRVKNLCKKVLSAWQKTVKRWIVKAKHVLRRRTWREKMINYAGKDPMVCPKCECYYEYKGEACLKDGQLTVAFAVCDLSRRCLERMIEDLTGVKKEKGKEKSQSITRQFPKETREERSRQICLFDVS